MNKLSSLKDVMVIDDVKYYHYTHGGKWTATKFIVWDGIHYYNSNKGISFEE